MTDLRLDPSTGDLDLTTGTVVLVEDTEAISQNLRIRLRFFLGEWFLDTRQGMPYFQKILGRKFKQSLVEQIFKQCILKTPGVDKILAFTLTFSGAARQLSLSFRVLTTSGAVLDFTEPFLIRG